MDNKYYIIDYGQNVSSLAKIVAASIQATNGHIIMFETDEDKVLCVEEVSEDEFLSMYNDITRNSINMN